MLSANDMKQIEIMKLTLHAEMSKYRIVAEPIAKHCSVCFTAWSMHMLEIGGVVSLSIIDVQSQNISVDEFTKRIKEIIDMLKAEVTDLKQHGTFLKMTEGHENTQAPSAAKN